MRYWTLLAPMVLLLGACTSYRAVTITVRDQLTREPVPEARVAVRPLHLFNPEYPHGVLTPSPQEGAEAITDAAGVATVDAPARHPFELFVLVPFESPRGVEIDTLADGVMPWTALLPGSEQDPDARTLEVRVE